VAADFIAGTFGLLEVYFQLRRALDRRIEIHWSRGQAPRVWICPGIGDLRRIHVTDLRAARFDRNHSRDELRPLLRDVETDTATLRVRQQDDGFPNPIEKRDAGRHREIRLVVDE